VKLGVFLPSYLLSGGQREHAEQVRRFAVRAEELGFASLFITDHLLTATRFYRVSWTEPLITLAYVASATSEISLGTSILVLPTRQPVVLAKEVATLQHLSGGRFIYGVGAGWYAPEFEATGGTRQQRGRRTDEVLEASMRLLRGAAQSYDGRFHSFRDITVEPLVAVPPVWVAGGRQYADESSPEKPRMDPGVLARICRWDGWIARPTAPVEAIEEDLADIDAELERQGTSRRQKGFTVAHENFCWLEEKGSREDVVGEQRRRMLAVVSEERPWSYIEAVYLTGTVEEVQRQVEKRIAAGVEHMFLHTMTPDTGQLELFAKHLLRPFADVPAGGRAPG
jgi:probable F420-dependent oxidoreductase